MLQLRNSMYSWIVVCCQSLGKKLKLWRIYLYFFNSRHLRHPNIVLFMGACTEPDNLMIVTELMNRGDVHSILRNDDIQLSLLRKLEMARDIAQGMNWLHCSNPPIIHRDLKPTNLLVADNWEVKICDFGLSAVNRSDAIRDEGVSPGTVYNLYLI